jgi:small subunit ribosomal protein S12
MTGKLMRCAQSRVWAIDFSCAVWLI